MLIFAGLNRQELEKISRPLVFEVTKELLRVHRRGIHLLVASRPFVSWALENLTFDEEDTATLRSLYGEVSQTGGLLDEASSFLNLVSVRRTEPGRVYDVTFEEIIGLQCLEKSVLIAENLTADCAIYKTLIKESARRHGAHLCCEDLLHGGGDDTASVVEAQVTVGRSVGVVLDGDMRSPHSKASAKSLKCKNLSSKSKAPFFARTLPCHEIENIIPVFLLERYAPRRKKPALRARSERS